MLEFVDTAAQAVSRITDGATVLIGGFGNAGQPMELIDALLESGATGLTVVNNNAGQADAGLALLIKERRVAKIICSFPRQSDSWHFDEAYRAGEIELELVPQGNLAERLRAGGAGIGGFFIPPGSPWRNGYVESFNSRIRDECLNINSFYSLLHAQVIIGDWKDEYNHHRRHSSLGYLTPAEYARQCTHQMETDDSQNVRTE
ncbi:3-oxoacid CoA-transferase subunit A [Micrococcus luteus]|uniref:3-oxoacid CoA-transferase subunit A n=1 Tax=Micrococcus luteus TaxID=1270 RepID=UPI0021AB9948|nr:3-oxoacid CoA-transferase subunit A [Micrococcus luteus]